MPDFDSLDGMSDKCKTGLRNVLTACADSKLLMGYHYGEWTFGTPVLEAAVANCSLAQSELGHVRLIHAILKKHYGDESDDLIERRDPKEFANVSYLDRELSDWAEFVAMNYVVDMAVTRVLHSLQGSTFKPLRMSVDKMLDEERYHVHHGQGWFRTLAAKSDESRAALQRAMDQALDSVFEWFGPEDSDEDAAMVAAGVKNRPSKDIADDFLSDIRALATELGVSLSARRPSSFENWSAATRRSYDSAPDAQILYHLQGSKNEMFKGV